jgi:Flp pilus assembly protein TadG
VKVLLIPFAIVAFVLFLLVLGAIGLGISMGVLAVLGRIWRLVMRTDRTRSA